jgi:hypothetical protein
MNGTRSERYLAIYAGVLTVVFAGTVLSGFTAASLKFLDADGRVLSEVTPARR